MSLWKGINPAAQKLLTQRNYKVEPISTRLKTTGVEARELLEKCEGWIPHVEIFPRKVYTQRNRGRFGEFGRQNTGALGKINMWPRQWATATMFAGTAKGFHIHPPFIPHNVEPEVWFNSDDYKSAPRCNTEQWDVMFFPQGNVEMILVDERKGLERNIMRFIIEGDDTPGPNNVGVVIPAGVAHALKVESSKDVIMVYGTSTIFESEFEGRIADSIEQSFLPADWQDYIKN